MKIIFRIILRIGFIFLRETTKNQKWYILTPPPFGHFLDSVSFFSTVSTKINSSINVFTESHFYSSNSVFVETDCSPVFFLESNKTKYNRNCFVFRSTRQIQHDYSFFFLVFNENMSGHDERLIWASFSLKKMSILLRNTISREQRLKVPVTSNLKNDKCIVFFRRSHTHFGKCRKMGKCWDFTSFDVVKMTREFDVAHSEMERGVREESEKIGEKKKRKKIRREVENATKPYIHKLAYWFYVFETNVMATRRVISCTITQQNQF